jgi:hypothetical protein
MKVQNKEFQACYARYFGHLRLFVRADLRRNGSALDGSALPSSAR